MLHDGLSETRLKELLSNGSTGSDGMTLSERTAGVLYSPHDIQFRVSRSWRIPLTELLQLIKGKLP